MESHQISDPATKRKIEQLARQKGLSLAQAAEEHFGKYEQPR